MRLYNSLTKKIEDLKPIDDGQIRMYSCGPTVYNNLHIGNLSAFVYADVLRRTLSTKYKVTLVMNITDVDDKTIRDSRRDYPDDEPMQALDKLTRKYESVFMDDTERIGNDIQAIKFIRATDTIQEMIDLTQALIDKELAYPAEDGIYFSIKNYELAGYKYGQLQQIDRKHEQARISNDEYDKKSASDFALWKRAEEGEPSWSANFNYHDTLIDMPGRPGWHIECSAMSQKLLGVPFDIHTGGVDLKFPHHENEIAQSSGATDNKVFTNYFIHNNHILIDGKKMSKSLGNFYTLRDIEAKGFSSIAFRLLVISSHYRNESNFTWEILEASQNRLNNWQTVADLRWQLPENDSYPNILSNLENDLDTPKAIAEIDIAFDQSINLNRAPNIKLLEQIKDLLGIDLFNPDITAEQKALIEKRGMARQEKNWQKSDELRDKLSSQGLELNDTPDGTTWSRAK